MVVDHLQCNDPIEVTLSMSVSENVASKMAVSMDKIMNVASKMAGSCCFNGQNHAMIMMINHQFGQNHLVLARKF